MKMNKPSRLVALLLLMLAAPLFAADDNPLIEAAKEGNLAAVKRLLNAGADLNARVNDGYTALIFAALGGNANTVKVLISAGANVNAKSDSGWTALFVAAAKGHTATANALRAAGAR